MNIELFANYNEQYVQILDWEMLLNILKRFIELLFKNSQDIWTGKL